MRDHLFISKIYIKSTLICVKNILFFLQQSDVEYSGRKVLTPNLPPEKETFLLVTNYFLRF